jgi:peptidoglycan hydrolase-like protein with peptidoglycan-binding domain
LAALIVLFCLAQPGYSAARTDRRSSPKTKSSTHNGATVKKSAGAAGKATSGKSRRRGHSVAGKRSKGRQTWRTGQMAPTPERYKEIQQALIDKGFYRGEASGVWGADSATALKEFQRAQNIDPTGKLDSLSLITLGLGPRRTASVATTISDSGSTRDPQ